MPSILLHFMVISYFTGMVSENVYLEDLTTPLFFFVVHKFIVATKYGYQGSHATKHLFTQEKSLQEFRSLSLVLNWGLPGVVMYTDMYCILTHIGSM